MGKLDDYLSKTNERLLNDFKWEVRGMVSFLNL